MTNGQGSQGNPPPLPPPQPLDPYGARSMSFNSAKISIAALLLMMAMSGIGASVSAYSCTNHRFLLTSAYASIDCVCYPPVDNGADDIPNPVQQHIGNFDNAVFHKYQLQGEVPSEIHPSPSDTAQTNVSKAVATPTAVNSNIQEGSRKGSTSETAEWPWAVVIDHTLSYLKIGDSGNVSWVHG